MMFLEYIDELYRKECKEFGIPLKPKVPFKCFIPVEPQNWEAVSNFLILKQEKSKLFILDGKQRAYLSDIQIVDTILSMDKEDQRWFLAQFVKIYKGEFVPFSFKIQSETFEGKGMCRYPQKKSLIIFTDSNIDINDFIFLINFIIYKDLCWSEKIEVPDFYRRTLCKYITLIDYYSLNHMRSEPFLKSIGYPLEKRRPVDTERKNVFFMQTETFDISLYE
ncbi:MAG: hypothetical protein P4L49_03395 [Desulfosporosinus sp.]|nr:hypothetical protein [Desulfosporosinus sp.]